MAGPNDPRPGDFYNEYLEATKDLKFTKDSNASLEALMHDELAPTSQRVVAWIKRQSWGNYRLFCVLDDGVTPALQRDCCAELGIDKTRLSHTISYLQKRGYIRYEDKLLIPELSPTLRGPGRRDRSDDYEVFFAEWQVANSVAAEEIKVARATLKRYNPVVLSDYKRWRASEKNSGASLIETKKIQPQADPRSDRGAPPSSSAAAAPSSVAAAPESILVALQRHGTTTPAAAGRLLKECKAAKPDCSLHEIIEVIGELAAGFSRNVKNPIGVLLKQVPSAVAARQRPPNDLDELRRRLRSSDHQTSIDAAGQILADEHAPVADRVDAAELLRAKGVP